MECFLLVLIGLASIFFGVFLERDALLAFPSTALVGWLIGERGVRAFYVILGLTFILLCYFP